VETSETERWQNGKMERTATKKIRCWILKLCKKQKFPASRLQRPWMTSSLQKLLAVCFKTSDGLKIGLLAARAISNGASVSSNQNRMEFDSRLRHNAFR